MAIAAPPGGTVDLVAINVVNKSEHPVRVTGIGFVLQDGSQRELHVIRQLPGANLPGELAARDSGQAFIALEDVQQAGLDVMKPLTVWARLSTNERFTTTEPLMRESSRGS